MKALVREGKGLTDVIGISVRQANAHILVQQVLQVKPEVGVDEVACVLERVVDAVVAGVVEGYAEGFLDFGQVEVVWVVGGWGGVVVGLVASSLVCLREEMEGEGR